MHLLLFSELFKTEHMETNTNRLSKNSVILLFVSSVLLCVSIFVPIWRIDLDAPQYPEGLRLLIHANKLGGNVDIINGLNHYIGMKTLHTEDFFEFKILPYLIGFFAVFSMVAAFARKKKIFYTLFTLFVCFGVVAMVDFWRWEYNYGHNLDPNAAIIVPGMAYQPPLIGFKQLLNFGAYSIPALGGWLFVSSGVLMLLAFVLETQILKSRNIKMKQTFVISLLFLFTGCSETQPEAAKLNVDNCDYCKMTIADAKFVAELITAKGRIYKFDDLSCLQAYRKENTSPDGQRLFVANFEKPEEILPVADAVFVSGEQIASPMGGNTAAFSNAQAAERFASERTAQVLRWAELSKHD